jgi:tRNA A37 threonylcarbamoyladenosine dehydratase
VCHEDDSGIYKEKAVKKNTAFNRLGMLMGEAVVSMLQHTRVILFGVGGVGSWCAEALIRSGIGCLTLVDSDLICRTNINRQLQATSRNVGTIKVHELARRLKDINPDAEINPRQETYRRGVAETFSLYSYDYVIDAIDSLSSKVDLIISAAEAGVTTFTALGASCKLDPTRIRVGSLWDSQGCHLGKLVRKRLRRRKFAGDLLCVYSEELLPPAKTGSSVCGSGPCIHPQKVHGTETEKSTQIQEGYSEKKQINGSVVHITGTFGFFLAGLVVQDVVHRVHTGKMLSRNTSWCEFVNDIRT